MHYNLRKILCGTALTLILGLAAGGNAFAQGIVSLALDDELPLEKSGETADASASELALFDETDDSAGISGIREIPSPPPLNAPEAVAELPQPAASPALAAQNAALPGLVGENEAGLAAGPNVPGSSGPAVPGTNTTTTTTTVAAALPQKINTDDLADKFIAKSNDSLFSQMSDIERQTTLLTLELRREKIKSEIEAIKAQRRRAEEEEKAFLEEK